MPRHRSLRNQSQASAIPEEEEESDHDSDLPLSIFKLAPSQPVDFADEDEDNKDNDHTDSVDNDGNEKGDISDDVVTIPMKRKQTAKGNKKKFSLCLTTSSYLILIFVRVPDKARKITQDSDEEEETAKITFTITTYSVEEIRKGIVLLQPVPPLLQQDRHPVYLYAHRCLNVA